MIHTSDFMKAIHQSNSSSVLSLGSLQKQNHTNVLQKQNHKNVLHKSNNGAIRFFRPSFNVRILCKAITNLEVEVKEGSSRSLQVEEPTEEQNGAQMPIKEPFSEDEEEEIISRIPVPRQRYIAMSKTDLLNALLSLFDNEKDGQDFLTVTSCLESILHAEHKSVLEELRHDYNLTRAYMENGCQDFEDCVHGSLSSLAKGKIDCNQENKTDYALKIEETYMWLQNEINQWKKSSTSVANDPRIPAGDVRVIFGTRFQRNFLQLLRNAGFQELSIQDLQLTSALNTDYLLTLPVDVDWKRTSSSSPIIFKRGYTTERQDGFLIGEKLDYLQSKLLQKILSCLSQPLLKTGTWINKKWKDLGENEQAKTWVEGIKIWLEEPLWPNRVHKSRIFYQNSPLRENYASNMEAENELPIYLAGQQAVPRYESILSSAGSRGRLLRKLLVWMGLLPSQPAASVMLDSYSSSSDPYLRPNFLSRVSLKDIWKPATKEICGNDIWRQVQAAFSVLFSRSTLQEPAFKELALLYTMAMDNKDGEKGYEFPTLQLKIYKRIPLPDLKVIFPNKKLSFRILDTVRLDIATILGLLAYFVNYRFEDFLSSPSAFMLDVIATAALIIYVTRVVLGYKQTWDRYQLLVNRTLYEKTLASGFGTVHFLVDASEQQELKVAILAYAFLLQGNDSKVKSRKGVADLCERFLFSKFKEQIEMPIDKAMETLLRLGLVTEELSFEEIQSREASMVNGIKVVPLNRSYEILKEKWGNLLH